MNRKQIFMGACLFLVLTGIFEYVIYYSGEAPKWIKLLSPDLRNQDLMLLEVLVNTTNYTNRFGNPVNLVKSPRNYSQVHDQVKENCVATNHIVFLKTHKTGSTTLASIFERYGYYNNLTFALPKKTHVFQPKQDLFNRNHMAIINSKYISAFGNNSWTGYNFLTNHARYNRPEMDAVVHNATYVTILRSPVEQFESGFGYFEMAKHARIAEAEDPITMFMEKPQYYFNQHFRNWYWSNNGQLYDLGLDHVYHKDPYQLGHKIRQLDFEIDLVMLTEYFDESLLLLRKLLCWDWDDILYFPKGIRSRSHRYQMSFSLKNKILAWNDGDAQLYDHFNKTLWQTIREYGPSFEDDLIFFRSKLKLLKDKCIAVNKANLKDEREEKLVLKNDTAGICHRVYCDDVCYTPLIRKKMLTAGFLAEPTKPKNKTVKRPAINFVPNRYKNKKVFSPMKSSTIT